MPTTKLKDWIMSSAVSMLFLKIWLLKITYSFVGKSIERVYIKIGDIRMEPVIMIEANGNTHELSPIDTNKWATIS